MACLSYEVYLYWDLLHGSVCYCRTIYDKNQHVYDECETRMFSDSDVTKQLMKWPFLIVIPSTKLSHATDWKGEKKLNCPSYLRILKWFRKDFFMNIRLILIIVKKMTLQSCVYDPLATISIEKIFLSEFASELL